jgi:DNA-binding transcriptional LysR family regulator
LDLRALEYFISIYETGSLSAASKKKFVAQPSISSSLKQFVKQPTVPLSIK